MDRLDNQLYHEDLAVLGGSGVDWGALEGATFVVSGATGMVGAFLVDLLMWGRYHAGADVRVLALGRSEAKARARLPHFGREGFSFEELDVAVPGAAPTRPADVVLHLASTTHPRAYAADPIGTVASNVIGLSNLLGYAAASGRARFLFASSVEVYGENRGDVERFDEGYCGYLDCNTMRASYPESKRCGEALCQAYAAQRNLTVFVPRLPRTYGPTLLQSDSKAIAQFIHKGVAGEDIVLKSQGTQTYSYLYVSDVVSGMMHVLTACEPGRAYNLADERSDASLRELAQAVADIVGTRVVFEPPDGDERAGYSTATRAMLDASRVQATGWRARYALHEGLERTIRMLRDMRK